MKEMVLSMCKVAIVDDEDYEQLNKWKWSAKYSDGSWYAVRCETKGSSSRMIRMHRQILKIDDPTVFVDHRNRDSLDNRRENLSVATNAQNGYNARKRRGTTSRLKGVTWDKNRNRWMATVMVNRRRINLGRFQDEEIAAHEYDIAAAKFFGEFANLNFPESP